MHRRDVDGRVRHDDVAVAAGVDPSGDGGIDAPALAELQSATVAKHAVAQLQLCTSHGLDIFDQAHQRLRDSGGDGEVRLRDARDVVDRVLTIVEDADPTFPPLRHITAP